MARWSIIHHAVQGTGHEKAGTPCQDKTCALLRNGVCVVALADGAGSAALSHYGAEGVTAGIAEELADHFLDYVSEPDGVAVKRKIVSFLDGILADLSSKLECARRDLASTLLAVASDGEACVVIHIGDGVIGMRKAGSMRVLSSPSNGEFSNTTTFTTSSDVLYDMRIFKGLVREVDGFVLMSDGTEASLYDKRNKSLAPYVERIFRLASFLPLEQIEHQVVESVNQVLRKKTSDDCSLVLMMRDADGRIPFLSLPMERKASLLGIRPHTRSWEKRVRVAERMLCHLVRPMSLLAIARSMHIRPGHAYIKLARFEKAGVLTRNGVMYEASMNWDRL